MLSNLIDDEEYAHLRRHCIRVWGDKGESVLHRAFLCALDSGTFNPDFQTITGKRGKRSAFSNYVYGILKSASAKEQLASGWSKTTNNTDKTQITENIEKIWVQIEIPAGVTRIDNSGHEHGIEEYPDTNDLESHILQTEKELNQGDPDAEEVAQWFIAQINAYLLHLRNLCDFNKLFVFRAICTKGVRIKNVAKEKGLSHENLTRFVRRIYYDLAERMGIPIHTIRNGISVIKCEETLFSQLVIQEALDEDSRNRNA